MTKWKIEKNHLAVAFFSFWFAIIATRFYILEYFRRNDVAPAVIIRDVHIHHIVFGFFFLTLAGVLFWHKRKISYPLIWLAGSALGLIIDEIGFLLNVQSYWEPKNFWAIVVSGIIFSFVLAIIRKDSPPTSDSTTDQLYRKNPVQPSISVIIPAFNEEGFLAKSLTSLCLQDYQDFELIVVNNDSSDKTAQIARSFGAKVLNEQRRGVGFARQRGFACAKGNIIATTDADTVVPPYWLSDIKKRFDNDQKIVAFGGRYELYSGTLWTRLAVRHFFIAIWLLDRLFTRKWSLAGSNMAIKKEAFLQMGGFRPELQLGEDIDLSHRLARVGKVVFSPTLIVRTSGRRFRHGLLFGLLTYAPSGIARLILKRGESVRLSPIRTETSILRRLAILPFFVTIFLLSYIFYSADIAIVEAEGMQEINRLLEKATGAERHISKVTSFIPQGLRRSP